jgi:predicted nucleotidyltransferase
MCNTSNSPSFKERVQCYINKEDEIKKDYQNRMNALNEEATADILANCPIKVSDVYVTESNNAWGVKRQYYKVAKLEANVNGSVNVYGCKRKLDKTWGKRDNMFMFITSIYNDFNTKKFTKVENYVEPTKD